MLPRRDHAMLYRQNDRLVWLSYRQPPEEELAVHSVQLRDQRRTLKGMTPGAAGSVVKMEKIKRGDAVRASLCVKGKKVKEVNGVVSEISQKGYVRLHTCRRWLKVVRKIESVEQYGT